MPHRVGASAFTEVDAFWIVRDMVSSIANVVLAGIVRVSIAIGTVYSISLDLQALEWISEMKLSDACIDRSAPDFIIPKAFTFASRPV